MMNGSPDTGKSGESTVVIKIQESTDSATTQESSGVARVPDTVEPSRTETSKTSIESAESRESPGVEKIQESTDPTTTQESSGMATSQNVVGPSGTETSKPEISKISTESAGSGEATVMVEIQESSGMESTQSVEGPSRTEISKPEISTTLIESAVSGESPGVEKIEESLRMATVQNLEGPKQDMNMTETTEGPQSVESQMDGGPVPLNSQTGALVPVQDPSPTSPYYLLQWVRSWFIYYPSQILWSFCSWFSGPASQTKDAEAGKSFKENIDKIREIIQSTYWSYLGCFQTYHKVGIFSRSSESEYEWLTNVLRSQPFHSMVSTVQPHYISNNGRLQFMEAVSQCTFGILYHTRNRGRINIVNVIDSLYDEELEYMSKHLGKGNVIVVVDDLEDTSDEERTRILDTQYSIKELAQDIILFNANEKKAMTTEEIPEES